MKFCKNCGAKLEDDAIFCMTCGINVLNNTSPNPNPTPTPTPGSTATTSVPSTQNNVVSGNQPTGTPTNATAPANPNTVQAEKPAYTPPAHKLATNRGLAKFFFLSIVTCGIYGLIAMSSVSSDINTVASKHDGRHTMHFCLVAFLFSWLTFGIVPFVWLCKLSGRIGNELDRRKIDYGFGAGTFWGWGFFGSYIIVGPFIFYHKLFKAMNLLCEDYNAKG